MLTASIPSPISIGTRTMKSAILSAICFANVSDVYQLMKFCKKLLSHFIVCDSYRGIHHLLRTVICCGPSVRFDCHANQAHCPLSLPPLWSGEILWSMFHSSGVLLSVQRKYPISPRQIATGRLFEGSRAPHITGELSRRYARRSHRQSL